MNKRKKRYLYFSIVLFLALVTLFVLMFRSKPRESNVLRAKFSNTTATDSLMIDERHAGYINLEKFVNTALLDRDGCFNSSCISYSSKRDSVTFKMVQVGKDKIFYGADHGKWWRHKYKNIPVNTQDTFFTASVSVYDSIEYIYIPYQILACLLDHIGEQTPEETRRDDFRGSEPSDRNTIRSEADIDLLRGNGKKVQTEGIVYRNVSDILSAAGDKTGDSETQLRILWKYVKDHWIYIHDPKIGHDTWRSASETINNYYANSSYRYTGDCDDFAIVMASFARQIGLESRLVVTWGNGSGHMHADYKDKNGAWRSLDWGNTGYFGDLHNHASEKNCKIFSEDEI